MLAGSLLSVRGVGKVRHGKWVSGRRRDCFVRGVGRCVMGWAVHWPIALIGSCILMCIPRLTLAKSSACVRPNIDSDLEEGSG